MSRGKWTLTEATVAVTFRDYSERWLTTRKVKGRPLADRSRESYRDLLDRFILPTFGHLMIHSIGRDLVDKWFDSIPSHTPTYRARAYALLRTILASATDAGYLVINPARIRGAGQTTRRHQVRPATEEELDALTQAMPPRYRLMVQLAAWCALRFGELTELRRNDIDTRAGVIRVRRAVVYADHRFIVKVPKSEAGVRDVAIPPHLLPLVRDHLLAHCAPGGDGLLFPSRNDPAEHLRQSALTRVFYPARKVAGRPDLRFHDLRHTGLTWAAEAGATLAELMSRAGHSTPQAALRYQHAAAHRDVVIAQRLSDMHELKPGHLHLDRRVDLAAIRFFVLTRIKIFGGHTSAYRTQLRFAIECQKWVRVVRTGGKA